MPAHRHRHAVSPADPDASRLPRATVVVTACGDDRGLRDTLERLRPQVDRVDAELLLIFNTWPDDISRGDRDELEGLVDVLLFEPRTGKSHALNTAVRATNSEVVAFTDDDATPGNHWLIELLRPLADDPSAAGVGGPIEPVFPAEGPPSWYRLIVARRATHFLGPKHHLEDGVTEYERPRGGSTSPVPLGANMAWRRSWLERFPFRTDLGPNRETGLRGGEDTCLGLEILEAGGAVRYAPHALVHHHVAPERMELDFVERCYAAQGLEYARVLTHLGRRPDDEAKLRRSARPQPVKDAWRRIGPSHRRIKRRFAKAFAASACEELERLCTGSRKAE